MTDVQRKAYPGLLYTDPTFQPDQSAGFLLNIFLNESQLIFSIINQETKYLLHLQSYNFFQFNNQAEFYSIIRDLSDKEDLFNLSFKTTNFYLYNGYNTLIPSELFDADYLSHYFQFNFDTNTPFYYAYDVLEKQGIVNVYGIPIELKKIFEDKFKSPIFYHNSTPLIEYLCKTETEHEAVYIYIQPHWMQIMVNQNRTPIFFNSFHYATPEDFIYYILYTYQQLKLDPETIPVFLLGEIVKDSVLFEHLYKYIRHVNMMKRPEELQIQKTFNMPGHFYYNIFCAGL